VQRQSAQKQSCSSRCCQPVAATAGHSSAEFWSAGADRTESASDSAVAARSLFEAALFSAEECAQFAQGDDLFVHLPAPSRDQNRAISTVDIASAHLP
jgi:hypothetical protein